MSGGVATAAAKSTDTTKCGLYLIISSLSIRPAWARTVDMIGSWKIIPVKAETFSAKLKVLFRLHTAVILAELLIPLKNPRLVFTMNW